MNQDTPGNPRWAPMVILALVAMLVLVSGLYVSGRASHYQPGTGFEATGSEHSARQYHWRLVTSWPKNLPGLGTAPELFATYVDQMSAGRLTVQVYSAGELVPALGVLDAVSAGSVEMGHSAAYYNKGKIPAAPFFTAVPFGMSALEQNAWIFYGGGLELWRNLYRPFNIMPFAGGNTGMQMAGWFNREVRSEEDLGGLKMRIPGIAGEVFTRAGGSAVAIAGGELYTSMQTGVIDATEWVGPYNDRSLGFHEVADYYYYPGWHEPSAMLEFQVNLDAWNSLPEDLQVIVNVATQAVNADMLAEYTARNATSLRDLREQAGIDPQPLPKSLLNRLEAIALEYYDELSEKDPDFRRIYASYRDFQKTTHSWLEMSEKVIFEYRENSENRQLDQLAQDD